MVPYHFGLITVIGATTVEDLILLDAAAYTSAEIRPLDARKIGKALESYREKLCNKEGEMYKFLDTIKSDFTESIESICQKLSAGGFETLKSLFYTDAKELEQKYKLKKEDAIALKAATNTDSMKKRGFNLEMILSGERKPALYAMLLSIIEKVQSIDICIVLDITGSMDSYLSMVKETLTNLVKSIRDTNKLFPRFGFVGYRDYEDNPEFEVHDFTRDADELITYLGNVKCTGGDDACEDIRGALAIASTLSWGNNMKMIVLIADAPPHGSIYHTSMSTDYFPDDHLKMKPTLESLLDLFANCAHLVVFKCNKSVKMMCDKFSQRYKAKGGNFIEMNIESDDAVSLPKNFLSTFKDSIKKSLRFGKYKATSGSRDASILSEKDYMINSEISMLLRPVSVTAKPDFKALIDGEEMKSAETREFLNSKFGMKFDVGDKSSSADKSEITFVISKGGIKEGTFRNAIPMHEKMRPNEKYMIKLSKTKGQFMTPDDIKKELATCVIADYLAVEFNKALASVQSKLELEPELAGKSIEFLECFAGEVPPGKEEQFPFAGNKFVFVEKLLEGEYKKFNNNFGWVSEDESKSAVHSVMFSLSQAFSHWSYEFTCGIYLVVDIQGTYKEKKEDKKEEDKEKKEDKINKENRLYLTDPAIHSNFYANDFGDTNCGKFGFAKFFLTHVCNKYCIAMNLFPPNRILNASTSAERDTYIKAAEKMNFKPLIDALRKPKGEVEEPLPVTVEIHEMVRKAKIKKQEAKKE